jgi:hypothetical protein
MAFASPIKWFDLIAAALLIFAGAVIWGAADMIAGHLLQEQMPEMNEFLARASVRNSEFALKRIQVELESTRAKWIEQRLASTPPVESLRARMDELKRQLSAADGTLAAAQTKGERTDASRSRQFAVSDVQAELDATRAKWVAERLSTVPSAEVLQQRMEALERSAVTAESILIKERRRAKRDFTRTYFRFTIWKRLWALIMAVAGTAAAFGIMYSAGKTMAQKIHIKANWSAAITLAAWLLAAVYGYQIAGAAAAVGAAVAGVFLLLKQPASAVRQ